MDFYDFYSKGNDPMTTTTITMMAATMMASEPSEQSHDVAVVEDQRGMKDRSVKAQGIVGRSAQGAGVAGFSDRFAGLVGTSQSGIGVIAKGGKLAGFFDGAVIITSDLHVNGILITDLIKRIEALEQQVRAHLPRPASPPPSEPSDHESSLR